MNIGALKQRIHFYRHADDAKDEHGFPLPKKNRYIKVVSVFAELKTLKGRSFYEAAQSQSQNNREFSIRYRTDVDPSMLLKWEGKYHDILSIENDNGLNRTMTVVAKVVV